MRRLWLDLNDCILITGCENRRHERRTGRHLWTERNVGRQFAFCGLGYLDHFYFYLTIWGGMVRNWIFNLKSKEKMMLLCHLSVFFLCSVEILIHSLYNLYLWLFLLEISDQKNRTYRQLNTYKQEILVTHMRWWSTYRDLVLCWTSSSGVS